MKVELSRLPRCTHWWETHARLRLTLPPAGVDTEVVPVEVTTDEDAPRLRFRGEPTVLVDGSEPFTSDSGCRVVVPGVPDS